MEQDRNLPTCYLKFIRMGKNGDLGHFQVLVEPVEID